jgi:hypothetical protein
LAALSAVPWMMSTGVSISAKLRLSRSSARTMAAMVANGCDSLAISGSWFIASHDLGVAREVGVLQLQRVRVGR